MNKWIINGGSYTYIPLFDVDVIIHSVMMLKSANLLPKFCMIILGIWLQL